MTVIGVIDKISLALACKQYAIGSCIDICEALLIPLSLNSSEKLKHYGVHNIPLAYFEFYPSNIELLLAASQFHLFEINRLGKS
jgi:hypothetical protein